MSSNRLVASASTTWSGRRARLSWVCRSTICRPTQAVRRALEFKRAGAEIFIIANADGVMATPNDELVATYYPGVPYESGQHPNETLLSIRKARTLLGYEPRFGWR